MTREEIERKLEEVEKHLLNEIELLKEKLEEVENEQEIPDFPTFNSEGERTWHINNVLELASPPGETSGHVCDFNYFHTKEYAEEFSIRCKMIAMMLHCKWYLDREYIPNWDDLSEKWEVRFNCDLKMFMCYSWQHTKASGVYFSSKAIAQKCADWMNAHWKY